MSRRLILYRLGLVVIGANRLGGIEVTGSRALDNLKSTPNGEYFDSPYLVGHHLPKHGASQQA